MRWLAGRFGLPESAGGMLVHGGSIANLTGLKLARDHAWRDGRVAGLRGAAPLAFYTSEEAHFTDRPRRGRARARRGGGAESPCRRRPADANRRARAAARCRRRRRRRPRRGRGDGRHHEARARSTRSRRSRRVARRYGAWFHVDAAYGGPIALSDTLRPQLAGIEQADSITVDAHKWLYAPIASAFILVRERELSRESFSAHAAYVEQERDVVERGADLGFEGLQLSRGFTALASGSRCLAHGRASYARRIEHDVALTAWLAERVEETPELELACPPSLSICCFRYRPAGVTDEEYLDRLNMRVMTELQTDGTVFPSNASRPWSHRDPVVHRHATAPRRRTSRSSSS